MRHTLVTTHNNRAVCLFVDRYLTWTDMKNAREKYMDHGCGVEVKDYAER